MCDATIRAKRTVVTIWNGYARSQIGHPDQCTHTYEIKRNLLNIGPKFFCMSVVNFLSLFWHLLIGSKLRLIFAPFTCIEKNKIDRSSEWANVKCACHLEFDIRIQDLVWILLKQKNWKENLGMKNWNKTTHTHTSHIKWGNVEELKARKPVLVSICLCWDFIRLFFLVLNVFFSALRANKLGRW